MAFLDRKPKQWQPHGTRVFMDAKLRVLQALGYLESLVTQVHINDEDPYLPIL